MDRNDHKSSMWWMMVPCLAIFLVLAFAGGTAGFLSWPLLIILGIAVATCVGMMFFGHGHGSTDDEHHSMTDMKQPSSVETENKSLK